MLALLGFLLAATVEAATVRGQSGHRWAVVLAAVVAFAVWPAVLAKPVDKSRPVTVAIVQGGVPGNGIDLVTDHRQVTRNHQAATERLASRVRLGKEPAPDLVIWPENSTAVDPFTDPQATDAIEASVEAIGRPLIVGAMVDATDPQRVLNQGIVWDPSTGRGAAVHQTSPPSRSASTSPSGVSSPTSLPGSPRSLAT